MKKFASPAFDFRTHVAKGLTDAIDLLEANVKWGNYATKHLVDAE